MAVTLAGIFLTALALSGAEEEPVYSTPPKMEPPEMSAEPIAQTAEGFWVCEFDGELLLYHNADRSTPIETTSIDIRSLRSADQQMLRDGVFFENYIDVVMFLEDFGP